MGQKLQDQASSSFFQQGTPPPPLSTKVDTDVIHMINDTRPSGDHNAQVLLNTIVYQVGYFFALRSCNEHRRLRHSPSQIQLHEPPGDRAYLVYREDISKGGLTSKKKKPKEVYQYANEQLNTRDGFV